MKIRRQILKNVEQTLRTMHIMSKKYAPDMAAYATLPPTQMFRVLANVPFVSDPDGNEVLKRPKYTMTYGGDCDCKAIAAAAYAHNLKIPVRFCATGNKVPGKRRIPLTHVFAEIKIDNKWVPFDCTYAFHIFGQRIKSDRNLYM